MGKQTRLERIAIEKRHEDLARLKYGKEEEQQYSANHPNAISNGDVKGKGNGTSITYSVPNENASTTAMAYNVDTVTPAGGAIDIESRKKAKVINLYNEENQYGKDSVDTTINRQDGQYYVL